MRGKMRQPHGTDTGGGGFDRVRPAMQVVAGSSDRTVLDIGQKLVDRFDIRLDYHAGIFAHVLSELIDYLIVER